MDNDNQRRYRTQYEALKAARQMAAQDTRAAMERIAQLRRNERATETNTAQPAAAEQ